MDENLAIDLIFVEKFRNDVRRSVRDFRTLVRLGTTPRVKETVSLVPRGGAERSNGANGARALKVRLIPTKMRRMVRGKNALLAATTTL